MKKNAISIAAVLIAVASWLGEFHRVNAQQPQSQVAPLYAVNAKYVNGVAPGYAPTAGSGLTLNISAGTVFCSGSIATYAGGTLTATASATNYVYLNTSSSCAPAIKTTAFASSDIPIAAVVAGSSAITSITDDRTMFFNGGGSSFSAGGDLSGSNSSQTVVGFDGNPLGSSMASPGDQTVPVFSTSTGKWAASSISTLTLPSWLSLSPDAPPSTAGSLDDEFNSGSSINTSRWTWVNQGSATAAISNGQVFLNCPAGSSGNFRYVYQAAPSTPWTVVMPMRTMWKIASFANFGLILSDSTGKFYVFGMSEDRIGATPNLGTWNSPTSANVNNNNNLNLPSNAKMYYAVQDDGTNLNFSVSYTGASGTFFQAYTVSRTAFLASGPTRVGFGCDSENSFQVSVNSDWFRRTQ